jgi:hypothetical protein
MATESDEFIGSELWFGSYAILIQKVDHDFNRQFTMMRIMASGKKENHLTSLKKRIMANHPKEIPPYQPEKPTIIPPEEPAEPEWPKREPEIVPEEEPLPSPSPTEIPEPPERT